MLGMAMIRHEKSTRKDPGSFFLNPAINELEASGSYEEQTVPNSYTAQVRSDYRFWRF